MGTDIHPYVECRNHDTGKWEPIVMQLMSPIRYSDSDQEVSCYNGRNYMLFGVLAGVRYLCDPIVDPRGIPYDASDYVKDKYKKYEDNYHTPSWLTLAELRLAAKDKRHYNKEERNGLKSLIHGIEFMADQAWFFGNDMDIRVVFWFDN